MKALIAMSGGVDSALAAKLTKEAGYDCIGCTMRLYDKEGNSDAADARAIADRVGIPFEVLDFREEFKSTVISGFIASYERAMTPNPCITCNRCLKFGKLFEYARERGCDTLVTGHYARIERDGERFLLKKALDETKDQSYVLYGLTQEQLRHILFPLGRMKKSDVRQIAEANGFVNAHKPDSQDICFIPDGDYGGFLERNTGKQYPHGAFLDTGGKIIGEHRGTVHYTIGQRKGLGIAVGHPVYVQKIDATANTVTLAEDGELYGKYLSANNFHWISGAIPEDSVRCSAKIRYRHKEEPATVTPLSPDCVRVVFDRPQRAITPGQSVVLYDGDTVLGGGIIESQE